MGYYWREPAAFPLEAASLSRTVHSLPVPLHQSVIDIFKESEIKNENKIVELSENEPSQKWEVNQLEETVREWIKGDIVAIKWGK